jgi:hypothetical protein
MRQSASTFKVSAGPQGVHPCSFPAATRSATHRPAPLRALRDCKVSRVGLVAPSHIGLGAAAIESSGALKVYSGQIGAV